MDFNEKISVIVPVYNCENYIRKCIESILNQAYKNIEVIVVDDGSTDSTLEILRDYQKDITIISQTNSGVSSARNTGIKAAKGEYIMFVDADDWIDQEMIKSMVNHIQPDLVVRCGMILEYPTKKENRNIYDHDTLLSKEEVSHLFINTYALSNPVCQLLRKEDINHMFDEKISYGEDFLFNYQNYFGKKVMQLKNNYYHYRIVENSMTNSLDLKKIMKICDDILNVYPVLVQNQCLQDTLYRVVKEMNKGLVRIFKNEQLTKRECFMVIDHYWDDQRLTKYLNELKYKTIIKKINVDLILILCIKMRLKTIYYLFGKFIYGFIYKFYTKE